MQRENIINDKINVVVRQNIIVLYTPECCAIMSHRMCKKLSHVMVAQHTVGLRKVSICMYWST